MGKTNKKKGIEPKARTGEWLYWGGKKIRRKALNLG
jgi:hypothetical protein